VQSTAPAHLPKDRRGEREFLPVKKRLGNPICGTLRENEETREVENLEGERKKRSARSRLKALIRQAIDIHYPPVQVQSCKKNFQTGLQGPDKRSAVRR